MKIGPNRALTERNQLRSLYYQRTQITNAIAALEKFKRLCAMRSKRPHASDLSQLTQLKGAA
jgi:hypothetical protein